MSGRSWTGRWGTTYREWQPRAQSAEGPILNRLAGREYTINESRDGEWTVKWLSGSNDVVARFAGDVRLIFVALEHLADRTDSEFGIVVDRVWQREPELSRAVQALSDAALGATKNNSRKRVKRAQQKPS